MSICSQDIKQKPPFDINQGPKLRYKFAKTCMYNADLDLDDINVYRIFCQILFICSQDIEWKGNSDVSQGP